MSQRIQVLDDALIDQIAAGEVIERPASVVRELLDNALDAGAKRIVVEVTGGGVGLLRVTDDGVGMSREDALLALKRHATSKIRSPDELMSLTTFGFRGEALPSIASVSRLTLATKEHASLEGSSVITEGGSAPAVSAIGIAPGTSVEVRDLFFNVPARRKFLKTQATELAHITEVCLRVALGHPDLLLSVLREGRVVREYLPVESLQARAKKAFEGEALTTVEAQRDGVGLLAMLGTPERARSGASGLYIFVNRRPVQERGVARAVAFAYGASMQPGRFPTGVIHLTVNTQRVDVNVHPQKSEVRFQDARAIYEAVTRMLAPSLGAAWPVPAARARKEASYAVVANDDGGAISSATDLFEAAHVRESSVETTSPRGPFGSLRVLAQVRKMLLVCEGEDALHIIDQHAADERVRFHRLKKAYLAREVTVQRLLFPERVEVAPAEAKLVDELRDQLLILGLDVTRLGDTTVAVHSIPSLLRRATPAHLLHGVLADFARVSERGVGDALDATLSSMACHGALRAGDELSPAECGALLRALDEVEDVNAHSPHGRPVVFTMPFSDLERRLGR